MRCIEKMDATNPSLMALGELLAATLDELRDARTQLAEQAEGSRLAKQVLAGEADALRAQLEAARCPDPECHDDYPTALAESADARAEAKAARGEAEAWADKAKELMDRANYWEERVEKAERELDAARAMLRKHEWCGPRTGGGIYYSGVSTCIECGNSRTADGHRPGCAWAAAAGEGTKT